jgi:hypothetical protein
MKLRTTILLGALLVAGGSRLLAALAPVITSETNFFVPWPIYLKCQGNANNPGAALDNNPGTVFSTENTKDLGFVVKPSSKRSVVTGLTIEASPGASYFQDPAGFTVAGSLDGTNWTLLGTGRIAPWPVDPAARTAASPLKQEFVINNTNEYYLYRVMIPNNRGIDQPPIEESYANVEAADVYRPHRKTTQIASLWLHGTVNTSSADQPLGFLVQPQDMAAESGDTFGTVAVANRKGVTYTWKLNGTTIYTAPGDTFTMHEGHFTLQGSELDEYISPADDGKKVTVEISSGPDTATSREATLTLLGDKVTGTDTHVVRFPLGAPSPANETVVNLMDGGPGSKCHVMCSSNVGFFIQPAAGKTIVNGLSLASANDGSQRDPAKYVFEASNDGTNWTTLGAGDAPLFPRRLFTRGIGFPTNTTAYYFYRVTFPHATMSAGNSGGTFQLGELHLHGTVVGLNNPPFVFLDQSRNWGLWDVWLQGVIWRFGAGAELGVATTKGTSALVYQWYVDGTTPINVPEVIPNDAYPIGRVSWFAPTDFYFGTGYSDSWMVWKGRATSMNGTTLADFPWTADGNAYDHSYHCVITCGSQSFTSQPVTLREIGANRVFVDKTSDGKVKVWWSGAEGATLKVSDKIVGGIWTDAPPGNPITNAPSATKQFYKMDSPSLGY